jgi:prepilin-type N-terminal cleavage/methylation domain-containing protein
MNTKATKHDAIKTEAFRLAFTLIELLTVIAIMSIIAAMVVTMGAAASQKKKNASVEADKNKLITMISSYYAKLNYYPPDNGSNAAHVAEGRLSLYEGDTATNPLVYELVGASNINSGANLIVFNSPNNNSTIKASEYATIFNRGGVANGDMVEPHSFFVPGPMPKEYAPYLLGTGGSPSICGLIVPAPLVGNNTNNFWHYDSSSSRRHNMQSFDLWAEYSIGSKGGVPTIRTNGNW